MNTYYTKDGTYYARDAEAISVGNLHRTDGPALIGSDGTEKWYLNGKAHRVGGPAIKHPDGSERYWVDGLLHREDGPAVTNPDGSEEWYQNGVRHRECGPALKWADGNIQWWFRGRQHRLDGTAVITEDGIQEWYIQGVHYEPIGMDTLVFKDTENLMDFTDEWDEIDFDKFIGSKVIIMRGDTRITGYSIQFSDGVEEFHESSGIR